MNFNYGYEKKVFEQEWAKKKALMIEAGMDMDAIEKMYDFDWQWFKNIRCYQNRIVDNYDMTEIIDHQNSGMDHGFGLADQITDIRLSKAINTLCTEELELLVQIVINDRKQTEIAKQLGVSTRMIHYRIESIKEKLKRKTLKQ